MIVACHHPPVSVDSKHGGSTGLADDVDTASRAAASGPTPSSPGAPTSTSAARTAQEYRHRWTNHLAHRLDRRKLAEVNQVMVLKLRDELRAKGLAESSVGSVLVVLRSVLAFARECDLTKPASGNVPRGRAVVLRAVQAEAISPTSISHR